MSPLNIIIKKTTLRTFLFIIVLFFTQHAFCQENRDNRDVVETITYNYAIPNYLIADTVLPNSFNTSTSFKYIHLFSSLGGVIDSVGFPELPFLTYNYELPYDAYDIRITMSEMQYDYFYLGNHIFIAISRGFR